MMKWIFFFLIGVPLFAQQPMLGTNGLIPRINGVATNLNITSGTITGPVTNTIVTPSRVAIYDSAGRPTNSASIDLTELGYLNDLTAPLAISLSFKITKTSGTAVLVGGTAVVSTVLVTANSRIFLTGNVAGGTPGALYVSARTPSTSFTITSTSGTDTSTVAWMLFEP